MADLNKMIASVMLIANKHKAELAGLTKDKVREAITNGTILGKGQTFLIYSPAKQYMGVKLGYNGAKLGYIASNNKGSGEALDLLNKLKDRFDTIALMVREDNPRALKFYANHGFTKYKEIKYPFYSSHILLWSKTA